MRESTRKGSALGQELPSPPSDGITSLRFSPQSDHLLVSSWDAKLRLYNATTNVLKAQFSDRAAVLDCCFHDDSSGFSANADFTVCRYDFNTSTEDLLGTHDAQVSCVEYSHASGQLVTGSWDKTVQCWDARGGTQVGTYKQSERVCKMSLVGHQLVVATKKRHLAVYDLRHMAESELQSLSSNKFETQCVRCYPDGTGHALSSADGRVTMDYFDTSEASQAKKYAFRCHRRAEAGPDPCYPVYGLDFHPVYGTLSTGGSDGYVNVWDGNSKKRLHQYSRYPNSIAALAFNRDGRLLAVACSSPVEEEEKKHAPAIYLRHLNEAEVRQKRREGKTPSHLP